MSDPSNGGNGGSNGTNGSSHGDGADGDRRPDPFARGVWLITQVGGQNVFAMIEGSDADGFPNEHDVHAELNKAWEEDRKYCVTLRRKYVFTPSDFPVPVVDRNGVRTGQLRPGSIPGVTKHEYRLDLLNDFPTHLPLPSVTFLSELYPEDIAQLRESVRNVDHVVEVAMRAKRSNIVMPNTAGI